jgi:hypothetical protein
MVSMLSCFSSSDASRTAEPCPKPLDAPVITDFSVQIVFRHEFLEIAISRQIDFRCRFRQQNFDAAFVNSQNFPDGTSQNGVILRYQKSEVLMAGRAIAAFKKKRHGEPEKTATESSVTRPAPVSLEERIRARAYAKYLQRDGQDGSAVDDWLRAEAEILAG